MRIIHVRPIAVLGLVGLGSAPVQAQQFRDLFQRISRAVVVVETLEQTPAPAGGKGFVAAEGLGSGTIISRDGKIVTAAHVVQTADRVSVMLKDGRSFTARVIASAPRADVALLQLEQPPADLLPAPLGNSDSLQTGDDIMVVGAPYGLSYTMTVGHVSGRHQPRGSVSGVAMELIQTDASINQGNSGGPMFNLKGEVVGVVSYILTQSGGFEGLGFAVSSNVARKLLLTSPSFWTGVDGVLLTGALARLFNVPQSAGMLVERVAQGSPGAALGLKPGTIPVQIAGEQLIAGGDIVLEIGGIPVSRQPDAEDRINQYLRDLAPGASLSVKVLRGGQVVTLSAVRPR